MTIQTLLDAWKASGAYTSIEAPATDADIQAAEEKIGATLPAPLREVYPLFNGGWAWELDFYPLAPTPDEDLAVINANEKYIEWEWRIPQEIRLFADDHAEQAYGIWLPACGNSSFSHPIIEVGELFGDGCMGVVGTNLVSFLRGRCAYHLVYDERDKLEEGGEELKRIQSALDMLQVPQSLRGDNFDDEMPPFRKWADPQLPDPYGTSYSQEYTITDLQKLFGAT